MKIAYFDCFSGISGDMILGALIDLGVPEEVLLTELQKLPLQGYRIHTREEKRGSIGGRRVLIETEPQPPRSHEDIRTLIEGSSLGDRVRQRSLDAFARLAEAEARVHKIEPARVHFHEVGALDSILDVVGSFIGFDHLGIERVWCSPLPLGRGFVETQHGSLPLPAPATVLLLDGVPVYDSGLARELVTPTGAAIVTTVAESFGGFPDMTVADVGYGVGTHQSAHPPNLLRVITGTVLGVYQKIRLLLLETNIDDMNPEFYDHLLDRLFALGVLDVTLTPVQMKKNRPGTLVRVLIEPGMKADALDILFTETTTLGTRVHEVERVQLPRRLMTVATPYGPVPVKVARLPGGEARSIPEYDACKRAAAQHGVPLERVYREAIRVAMQTEESTAP